MNSPLSQRIRASLRAVYPASEAANIDRLLCCEVFGQSSVDYYLGKDITLSAPDLQKLESILHRLQNFEPLQYVLGRARFCGRDFRVAPGVLIPRPETEELVERVVREVPSEARLLDIGTGSGCIAVTMALELPGAEVSAWDVSPQALAIARANSEALQARVSFSLCDVLTHEPDRCGCLDAVVSNPPYVLHSEEAEMERQVLDWEPRLALFVPDADPLRFYRRIGELSLRLLVPGGWLYFEINRAYGDATVAMLRRQGYRNISLHTDISGNDRFVKAQK